MGSFAFGKVGGDKEEVCVPAAVRITSIGNGVEGLPYQSLSLTHSRDVSPVQYSSRSPLRSERGSDYAWGRGRDPRAPSQPFLPAPSPAPRRLEQTSGSLLSAQPGPAGPPRSRRRELVDGYGRRCGAVRGRGPAGTKPRERRAALPAARSARCGPGHCGGRGQWGRGAERRHSGPHLRGRSAARRRSGLPPLGAGTRCATMRCDALRGPRPSAAGRSGARCRLAPAAAAARRWRRGISAGGRAAAAK